MVALLTTVVVQAILQAGIMAALVALVVGMLVACASCENGDSHRDNSTFLDQWCF